MKNGFYYNVCTNQIHGTIIGYILFYIFQIMQFVIILIIHYLTKIHYIYTTKRNRQTEIHALFKTNVTPNS